MHELVDLMKQFRANQASREEVDNALYYVIQERSVAHLRRRGVSDSDLEDALHDTYLRASKALSSLRDPDCLPAWLFRVSQDAAKRYRGHRALVALDEGIADKAVISPAFDPTVEAAINQLPPVWARVIELVYSRGCSQAEIAKCCDRSPMRIKKILRKAHAALRLILGRPVKPTLYVRREGSRERLPLPALSIGTFSVGATLINGGVDTFVCTPVLSIDGLAIQPEGTLAISPGTQRHVLLRSGWHVTPGRHDVAITVRIRSFHWTITEHVCVAAVSPMSNQPSPRKSIAAVRAPLSRTQPAA